MVHSCIALKPVISKLILSIIFYSFSGNLSSVNITQSKWATRWITIKKSSTNSTNLPTNGKNIHPRYYSTKQGNETKTAAISKKGKFSKLKRIRKSWGWKAGAGWTILSVLDWWLLAAGGWLTWRNLILKWTPIGIGLASLVHWHLHYRKCDKLGQPRTASKIMVTSKKSCESSHSLTSFLYC